MAVALRENSGADQQDGVGGFRIDGEGTACGGAEDEFGHGEDALGSWGFIESWNGLGWRGP